MKTSDAQQLLRINQVAERLGVDRSTVYRELNLYAATAGAEGLGPITWIRGKRRIASAAVSAYVACRTVNAAVA